MRQKHKIFGGGDINPLNGKEYSQSYYEIKEKIDNLPSSNAEIKEKLFNLLDENEIIILKGETGSGKSVNIPQYLLKEYLLPKNEKAKIVVSQPRTLNAKNIASFVAKILDVNLGEEVGYKYRNNNMVSNLTRIAYETDGTLLQEMYSQKGDKKFKYDIVMIDEVHERSINIDILLMLIKVALENKAKNNTKFIIMSATLEYEPYRDYFSEFKTAYLDIPGRTFPVKSIYLKKTLHSSEKIEDYDIELFSAIDKILSSSKTGDILIFVESQAKINALCREINELYDEFACFGLYRGVSEKQQQLAIDKDLYKTSHKAKRKIVISTDIAESGVTVEGILFVIDTGLRYNVFFKNRTNFLEQNFITKDAAEQRKGRAGRTQSGTCYHLYTFAEFEQFKDHKSPEILTTNIDSTITSLLSSGIVKNIENIRYFFNNLMDKPTDNQINETLEYLHNLHILIKECSAIDNDKSDDCLTKIGKCISNLPVEPPYGRVLLSSHYLGISNDIIDIIAILNIEANIQKWIIMPPKNNKKMMNKYKKFIKKIANSHSDFIAILEIAKIIRKNRAKRFPLNMMQVSQFNQEVKRIKESCAKINEECRINSSENNGDDKNGTNNKIIQCFSYGFYNQIAKYDKKKHKYCIETPQKKIYLEVSPQKGNYVSKLSKYIMYAEHNNILGADKLANISNLSSLNNIAK